MSKFFVPHDAGCDVMTIPAAWTEPGDFPEKDVVRALKERICHRWTKPTYVAWLALVRYPSAEVSRPETSHGWPEYVGRTTLVSRMNPFSTLTILNGQLYQRVNRLLGRVSKEEFYIRVLFCEHVFGATSYLLKGKLPSDTESRVSRMDQGLPLFQKLDSQARYEWSAGDRYISFVILMHAWVRLNLGTREEEIQTIPSDLENFEPTDLGIVSYFMQELGQHVVPSVGNEFVEPFRYCQGAAIRGLAGKIVPSEFAEARVAFEKLETLFDSLWVDEPRCVALRGYLAVKGFCLGWLEIREELIP